MNREADNSGNNKLRIWMSRLLQAGVITSVTIIIAGGILFFIQHPGAHLTYNNFIGEPSRLRHVTIIFRDAFTFRSRAVIQFGILVLIATPVMRVLFSLVDFVITKDWVFVVITGIVISVLLFSLFF